MRCNYDRDLPLCRGVVVLADYQVRQLPPAYLVERLVASLVFFLLRDVYAIELTADDEWLRQFRRWCLVVRAEVCGDSNGLQTAYQGRTSKEKKKRG